jgi:hypothetical protein
MFHAETEGAILLLEHDQDAGLAFLLGSGQFVLEVAQFQIKEVFFGIACFGKACSHAEYE